MDTKESNDAKHDHGHDDSLNTGLEQEIFYGDKKQVREALWVR